MKLITLKDIVDDVLVEAGTYDESEYLRYLKVAIRGFTRLNILHIADIKVAYLPISDINTVSLPSDYVSYSKIGININGDIWTLGLNDKMAFARTESCGLRINELANVTDTNTYFDSRIFFSNHYRDGTYVTNLFGLGGGLNTAYYRIDKEYGVIQLQGSVPQSEIVLEYVSNGISENGSTIVPIQAREAMIAWVQWKTTPRDQNNKRLAAKNEYLEEVEELRSFESIPTLDELMDAIYAGYKQSPKR